MFHRLSELLVMWVTSGHGVKAFSKVSGARCQRAASLLTLLSQCLSVLSLRRGSGLNLIRPDLNLSRVNF